jgi:hypothetical protein
MKQNVLILTKKIDDLFRGIEYIINFIYIVMKYFFLADGWTYNRIWERGGIWNENAWRRKPHIQSLSLGMIENNQVLWLNEVEDTIIMVEVIPVYENAKLSNNIGQVVLKRLIDSDQVIETLTKAQQIFKS